MSAALQILVNGQSVVLTSLTFGASTVPLYSDQATSAQVTLPTTITADTVFYITGAWNVPLVLSATYTQGLVLPAKTFTAMPGAISVVEYPALTTTAADAASAGGTGLSLIADQRILGNVSGSTAVPTAMTALQTRTFVAFLAKRTISLTDAATVAWNTDGADNFTLLATPGVGNTRQLGDPSGTPTDGQVVTIEYTQDGTGGRNLTVSGGAVMISNDLGGQNNTAFTVPVDTTGNGVTLVTIRRSSAKSKWVVAGVARY